jgi:DNA topoisomerase II
VNGSAGIGTGWSTFVPCYNPIDIIQTLKLKLRSSSTSSAPVSGKELVPWYHGFTGTIKPSKTEPGKYYTFGKISWQVDGKSSHSSVKGKGGEKSKKKKESASMSSHNDGNEVLEYDSDQSPSFIRVFELPIGKWTEDYKVFLQSLILKGTVKNISEHHSESSVDFILHLSPQGIDELKTMSQVELLSYFKLSTSISIKNMNLFNMNGVMKRYNSPEEIISEFIPVRKCIYYARLLKMQMSIEESLRQSESKLRFLHEIVNNSLIISKKSKDELRLELWNRGYPVFIDSNKKSIDSRDRGIHESKLKLLRPAAHLLNLDQLTPVTVISKDASSTNGASAQMPSDGFDYLLNMSLWQLTSESIAKITKENETLKESLKALQLKTPEEVWIAELENLEQALLNLRKQ